MPTKLNKAGNQQNYVPAGNGDASGEYGDNATGSNKHFTNFAKPTNEGGTQVTTNAGNVGETTQEPPKQEEIKNSQQRTKEELSKDIEDRFEKQNDLTKEFSNKVTSSWNESGDKHIGKMLEENDKLVVKFGGSGRNAAGCATSYLRINIDSKEEKTMNHELGHVWDSWYGKDLKTNADKYPMSTRVVTRYVDDVEGKCFDEVIAEELGIHTYRTVLKGWQIKYEKTGVDKKENKIETISKLAKMYDDFSSELFDEDTGIKNSYDKLQELRDKKREDKFNIDKMLTENEEVKQAKQEYDAAYKNVYTQESLYADKKMREGAFAIYYSQSPEVMAARQKRDEMAGKLNQVREKVKNELKDKSTFTKEDENTLNTLEKSFFKVYKRADYLGGIMGDMQDYLGVSRAKYGTLGHGSNYFNNRKDDGFSCEIFANMFGAYNSNDGKKQYEVMKKMLPRTTALFERALQKFGNKEKQQ